MVCGASLSLGARVLGSMQAVMFVALMAVLFIETKDEFDFQLQLIDYLKLNLKSWEVPKQLIVLPEFLYTKSGKIDRSKTLTLYLNNLKS